MKTNQNGFSMLVAVLIAAAVFLAGAGVFVYQMQIVKPKPAPAPAVQKTENLLNPPADNRKEAQTAGTVASSTEPIDISGWKTYRNEEWGFGLKYPASFTKGGDWEDSVRITGGDFYIIIGFSDKDFGCKEASNAETLIRKETFKVSDVEIVKNISVGRMAESTLAYRVNYYTKAKANCINFEFIKDFGPNSWFDHDKYPEGKVVDYKLYDQIVSTFKFIESQSSNEREEVISRDDFNGDTAYIRKETRINPETNEQHYRFYLIYKKSGGSEMVLEETEEDDNSGNFKTAKKDLLKVDFSPKGNYLVVKAAVWESFWDEIYDLKKGSVVFNDLKAANTTGFTPDEKYFYSCGNSDMGAVNMLKVVLTDGMKVKYEYGGADTNETEGAYYSNINCGYDDAAKMIYFDLKNSVDVVKKANKAIKFFIESEKIIISEPIDISNWKTYSNEEFGFEFKYPANFFQGEIANIDVANCDAAGFSNQNPCPQSKIYVNQKLSLNGNEFWRCQYDDGAAGSDYKHYQYIGIASGKCFSFEFVVRHTDCGVYGSPGEPAYQQCERENQTKSETVGNIEKTFKFVDR